METSLTDIGIFFKLIYAFLGFTGLTIIMFRNRISISNSSEIFLIQLLIILSVSESIFALIGLSTFYKFSYSFLITIIFLLNLYFNNHTIKILGIFILLTLLFFISTLLNNSNIWDALTIYITLSTPILFVIIFTKKINFIIFFKPLVKDIILLQVIMAVVKLIFIGNNEALIGTIGFTNGSIATIFPLLALIFLWQSGYINSNKNLLLWVLILSIIPFASNKRAYWFIIPIILIYILYFNNSNKQFKFIQILKFIPFIILLFYFGLKLNPTLNPENTIGGQFDFNYAVDYAFEYTFAPEYNSESEVIMARGSGVFFVFNDFSKNINRITTLVGNGVDLLHAKVRSEQHFLKQFGFLNMGMLTGFSKKYITLGILGVLLFLLYIIRILNLAKHSKSNTIYFLMVSLVLFEFLLYKGVIFENWGLTSISVYIICNEYRIGLKSSFIKLQA